MREIYFSSKLRLSIKTYLDIAIILTCYESTLDCPSSS